MFLSCILPGGSPALWRCKRHSIKNYEEDYKSRNGSPSRMYAARLCCSPIGKLAVPPGRIIMTHTLQKRMFSKCDEFDSVVRCNAMS